VGLLIWAISVLGLFGIGPFWNSVCSELGLFDGSCTGHFVMVPLNLACLHCLQHSFFELLNIYIIYNVYHIFITSLQFLFSDTVHLYRIFTKSLQQRRMSCQQLRLFCYVCEIKKCSLKMICLIFRPELFTSYF